MKLQNTTLSYSGFTLIELVVVILLLGILATYVAPRLNLDGFRQTGFVQQTTAAIRFAQKQAIGSGCEVSVSITAVDCSVQFAAPVNAGCPAAATTIINPATGQNNFCDNSTPEATADLPTTIQFDNIGRPTATAGDLSLVLGSRTIIVATETGFAYEP